jgi:hypothetical protein
MANIPPSCKEQLHAFSHVIRGTGIGMDRHDGGHAAGIARRRWRAYHFDRRRARPPPARRPSPTLWRCPMKRLLALLALAAGLVASAGAQPGAPVVILPERLDWSGPPAIPALKGAWMVGAEGRPGPYLLRVRLAAGGRIPPHTHPDERHTTVLSGTLHVGFGETFDEAGVVAVPAGAVYVAPAGLQHYVWAKDGAAEYQEAGVGPTATDFIAR